MPSYLPVMQYADSRALRETLYRAYATRAAEVDNGYSKPEWDNGPLIKQILALRAEEAQMLGYRHFADVSLVPKMADTPEQVLGFLRDLAAKAKPFAERDLAELQAFARDELGLAPLEPWDVAYVSEKLRIARYAFSEQEVKEYLPEHKVLQGLFGEFLSHAKQRVLDFHRIEQPLRRLTKNLGPRVKIPVDPVPEPHQPAVVRPVLDLGQELVRREPLTTHPLQHLHHRNIRTAMLGTPQRHHPGRAGRIQVRLAGGHRHRKSRAQHVGQIQADAIQRQCIFTDQRGRQIRA